MEEEKEGERACDGEMIERQRKKKGKKNPLIIHGECMYDAAKYGRTFDM